MNRVIARIYRHRLTLGAVMVLGGLWAITLDSVRLEWGVNPQYTYGWLVPPLVAYLLWHRWRHRPRREVANLDRRFWRTTAMLAILLLPARLIQEANPAWRLTMWLLAGSALGLTLALTYALGGRAWLRHFAFPLGFSLVAIPWPTVVESPLIQGLTRLNATVTVELLHLVGVPALQRGNLVEIAAGVVGIEEACSGIRSFQASLMLALFFGELTRLGRRRRVALIGIGFGVALLANLARTLLLISVALRQGLPAMEQWHGAAGLLVLAASFTALWWVSRRLARGHHGLWRNAADQPKSPVALPAGMGRCLLALGAWMLLVEAGVEAWYRLHERGLTAPVTWTITAPRERPEFRELAFTEAACRILRFDEGLNARWREADGKTWQMIFVRWEPGRVGVQLAKNHTPDICLAADGRQVTVTEPLRFFDVAGLRLPFRVYRVTDQGATAYVFYSLWEDQRPGSAFGPAPLNLRTRLTAVAAGRRNLGQRSLELVLWDQPGEAEARVAVQHFLEQSLRKGDGRSG